MRSSLLVLQATAQQLEAKAQEIVVPEHQPPPLQLPLLQASPVEHQHVRFLERTQLLCDLPHESSSISLLSLLGRALCKHQNIRQPVM